MKAQCAFTFQSQNQESRLQHNVCLFLKLHRIKTNLTPFSQTLLLSLERSQDLLNYVGFRLFLLSSKIPNCCSLVAHSLDFSLFLYLLCWIKHVASEGFYSSTAAEENKNPNMPHLSLCGQVLLRHLVFSKTFPAAVYVGNVTTMPYSFQFKGYSMVWLPAGPPTAARTCLLPKRAFLHSKPWETPWLKLGSRGQRWRVNVSRHSDSLPLRQWGV